MTKQILTASCMFLIAAALGCGSQESDDAGPTVPAGREVKKAMAYVNALGDNEFQGSAIFVKAGDQIELMVTVELCPPGEHAVHIHEFGDCGSEDGMSAGGHWNPTGEAHGKWDVAPFHLGDIGNIVVGEDGTGTLSLITDRWSMGTGAENDIVDKAVIVHVAVDDFVTQPTGAAGGRIGCGVIRAQ
jgi:Cu-Zn family superoxide dismutase